jgi:6-phosphogluconolactonase
VSLEADAWPIPGQTMRVVDDVPTAFASTVARSFAARTGARFSLALSGGQTARDCYEELAHTERYAVDWARVDVYIGDERCVPPGDHDANQRLVRESLLDRVGEVGSFHPMSCDDGAAAYQAIIEAAGELDLVHLGMGPDGHTASLFPGSTALAAGPGELVALNTDPKGVNPHPRMTLTFPGIARSRLAVVTVTGAEKTEALEKIRDGDDLPAAQIRAGAVLWLVDVDAAGT